MKQVVWATAILALGSTFNAGAQSFGLKAPQRLSVAVEVPIRPLGIGDRFALSLRIVPNPGIHVYAPGNPDNIPVSVSVTPPSGLAVEPAKFPKAEDFFFGPLAETLKVYTKPFVVSVPMQIDHAASAAAKSAAGLTVAGTVRYQACDDRVCFPPQSTPFEARVALRAQVR